MKITAIETLVCHARMRNWVFVKVVTDQPGLIGWGEATLDGLSAKLNGMPGRGLIRKACVFMLWTSMVRRAASFGRRFRLGLLPGREER